MDNEIRLSSTVKNLIKGVPVIGSTAGRIARWNLFLRARNLAFPGSGSFWESVYVNGGTSGPGSYGRLAEFKAEVLNEFVHAKNIASVIEFGCGDGAQLQLAKYPRYVGVDVAARSVARCSSLF